MAVPALIWVPWLVPFHTTRVSPEVCIGSKERLKQQPGRYADWFVAGHRQEKLMSH